MIKEDFSFEHLCTKELKVLDRLLPLLGPEGVESIASQGPDAIKSRLRVFSDYENALSEHIYARMPSPAPPVAHEAVFRPRPLMVTVQMVKG